MKLYFLDESAAPCINDIRIEEIIVDHLPQIIFSQKTFMKNVTIYGNVTAKFVNGQNLTKLYEQSVLLEKDANITGNIVKLIERLNVHQVLYFFCF